MSSKNSANKTARQAEKRRSRNRATKSSVSTLIAKVERKIAAKDIPTGEEAVAAISSIDKAANKGVFHRNKAARLKSRLAKKMNLSTSSLAEGDQPHTTSPS